MPFCAPLPPLVCAWCCWWDVKVLRPELFWEEMLAQGVKDEMDEMDEMNEMN